LRSFVCFFCWILFIFTSRLLFSLLLAGGYHRLFFIFVMPVSSMCMRTSNLIDAAFSILLQAKAFFSQFSDFLICVVWFGCPAFVPILCSLLFCNSAWQTMLGLWCFSYWFGVLLVWFFTIQVSHASFNQEHATMEKNV